MLAVSGGGIHAAMAQEAGAPAAAAEDASKDPTTLGAVVVSGTRASIQKSQALKQDAVGTVDAVSAEDVGKFPDQNVADSLQRIAGVSVDRSGGEARYITVRGFGPEFNTVLLNGRTMATENAGREFSFDVLPSELISTAEVFKTSQANLSEGGIGATVNIKTRRPLDDKGFHIAGSVSAVDDSMSGKTKPKISGLISDTNADGTFGALLGFVRYQRDHTSETIDDEGWLTGTNGINGVGGLNNIAVPRTIQYKVNQESRTRTGVNAALDWLPAETVRVTMDAMYSKYEIDSRVNAFGLFTDPADVQSVTADGNGTATSFVRGNTGGLANDHIVSSSPRNSVNQQVGVNVDWSLSDQTSLNFDGSYSKAEENSGGKGYFMVLGARNVGVNPTWNLNPGGFPSYSHLLPTTDTSDLRAHFVDREGDDRSDELYEGKLSLTRNFLEGTLSQLQFGVSGSKRTKGSVSVRTSDSDLNCVYCGYAVRVPGSLASVFGAGSLVDGASRGGPTQWLSFDPQAYFDYLSSPAAYNQFAPGGEFYDPNDPNRAQRIADALSKYGGYTAIPVPQSRWQVEEKSYSAFAQANFENSFRGMPWTLNLGVRFVKTDAASRAVSSQVESITGTPGDPTNAQVHFTAPIPIQNSTSYQDWLPSMNFRINVRDNVVLRASASETLTRPTLTSLRISEDIGVRPPGPGSINTGNIDLKPYKARNYDLGAEWYINDTSYLGLAGFYKKVENFVTNVTRPTTIQGYPFLETLPVNANTAVVKGAELSFQYTFDRLPAPFDGLGVQANYTYVDSKQSFDPSIATGQFAVVGLANSGNLIVFYEKGPVSFRAAYNWRDEYLAAVRGSQGEPTTVEPYGQIDLSGSYKLNEHVSLFAEATNVNNETEAAYSRYANRVQWVAANGRALSFGIRGSW
ncbi:TonB-dependent receptor [Lysobacter sp. K5869]|uniref:TonB-dependent receptor n=1 Tax=Lysobacter sp. K5869 TaxID=2820808 RepID=UPI001C05F3AE|nr:TonB-dependent receptor [Lysobacter sp. K5869]QWP76967.1 TonB-dependent receptor [Lysobacter sp. K5869]